MGGSIRDCKRASSFQRKPRAVQCILSFGPPRSRLLRYSFTLLRVRVESNVRRIIIPRFGPFQSAYDTVHFLRYSTQDPEQDCQREIFKDLQRLVVHWRLLMAPLSVPPSALCPLFPPYLLALARSSYVFCSFLLPEARVGFFGWYLYDSRFLNDFSDPPSSLNQVHYPGLSLFDSIEKFAASFGLFSG